MGRANPALCQQDGRTDVALIEGNCIERLDLAQALGVADRVQLHFEIRRLGKPVDPARLLPPR